ncbi:hypothetical protein RclHR1_03520021 [Rhizophagus clarus]|uniref:Uncharacterized protein n=1 Tax=Rhizophagus clarus TaxID=94130 RepID=A0A2Z6RSE7_9GLOM|nr:hypothetical protein RclHR1_03520021 [Rhizophagus clarus]GET04863.1 hypothetical protein GLOIN_2v1782470 [Rhizophagus clarus]
MTVKLLKLLLNLWVSELKKFLKNLNLVIIVVKDLPKKRKWSTEINNDQPDVLEVIDINFLSEVITDLLENASPNNQELHLHCQISDIDYKNSPNENLTKELQKKLLS